MREYAITLLVALIGGLAGGVAARWLGGWMRGIPGLSPRRTAPSSQGDGGGDRRQLEAIRSDLWALRDIVGRVLQDVGDLSRKLDGAPSPGAAPVQRVDPPRPGPRSSEPPRREPAGWNRGPDAGTRGETPYREPAPLRDSPYDGPPGPYDLPPANAYDAPAAGSYDAPPDREVTARPAAGPPPNAVNVEARDDRIVSSSSYPPEAWLEPRGPAVGHLWLNPGVALNENALRRLSTFFQWQSERAGATYDTETPAVVRWDEGQRVGTVSQRGTARPR
jgi:hypothetical protein